MTLQKIKRRMQKSMILCGALIAIAAFSFFLEEGTTKTWVEIVMGVMIPVVAFNLIVNLKKWKE